MSEYRFLGLHYNVVVGLVSVPPVFRDCEDELLSYNNQADVKFACMVCSKPAIGSIDVEWSTANSNNTESDATLEILRASKHGNEKDAQYFAKITDTQVSD